jgi:cobalt-zinc-cadmium efflux system protein
MTHDHDHHHHHSSPAAIGHAFAWGTLLNLTFVVVEATYGVLAHSMALLADAGHNLGDVLGLALAWGAATLARRKPTSRRTYGLRRTTILASLSNALLLLFVIGGVAWESLRRLSSPEPVAGLTVLVIALMGVAVNGGSALLFFAGRKSDMNVRGAFFHLAADAAMSLGVVVAGALMLLKKDWTWLDPTLGLLLSLVILASVWSLLRDSMNLALDAVPEGIDPDAVRSYLAGLPGVCEVHDLHIWAMSTTETALTAHLIMPGDSCHPKFLHDVGEELHEHFHIEHATLQVESPGAPSPCRLAPDERV